MTEEELNVQVQAAQDEIARLRETFGPAYAKLGEALYPVARETELAARFANEFAEVDAINAAIDEQNAAIEAARAEYETEQARIAEEEAARAAEEAARAEAEAAAAAKAAAVEEPLESPTSPQPCPSPLPQRFAPAPSAARLFSPLTSSAPVAEARWQISLPLQPRIVLTAARKSTNL